MNNKLTLSNKKVMWAFVNHTRTKYKSVTNEQEYAITVCLNDAEYNNLVKLGLNREKINRDEDGNILVVFSQKTETLTGTPIRKPPVFDRFGNPYKGAVGNGSICDIALRILEYKPGAYSFKYNGLKIVELVEYIANPGFKFDKQEDAPPKNSDVI